VLAGRKIGLERPIRSGVGKIREKKLTELLSSDYFDNSSTISIKHIMQSLYMRETILAPEAGLKTGKRWRNLHHVVVEDAYLLKNCDALMRVRVLCCRGE
jgi:hypothetical protein